MKIKASTIFWLITASVFLWSCEAGELNLAPSTRKSGSTARFAINHDHLYVVDDKSLRVFEISSSGALSQQDNIFVSFGVETIFALGNNLFLGANDAVYIYDIEDRDHPKFVSRYAHIIACDPVVVQGNFAYVTLRIRDNCRTSGEDALEIIDISNPSMPTLVSSYTMQSPYGLGIDGEALFVCEGDKGLKIYQAANPTSIQLLGQYSGFHAYDVIPNDGVLILTGNDGIFQYAYQDPLNITLLSHIAVHP